MKTMVVMTEITMFPKKYRKEGLAKDTRTDEN